ncbi:YczE/YyaS/YitT family protein [Treponema zioleckii]|uniref:YczE/YyaS/YitT family protein n=1 Tax=Treponema zioleckii TaxID=331680 RepID=UPI00168B462C|nr:hypothetical protein [Treponema zioleckii]
MGFFLSFLRSCGWGTDPCTFQNDSIRLRLGISFGSWQLMLNAAMFVLVVIFNRSLIGAGTVANWVLIGYTADFFNGIWARTPLDSVLTTSDFLPIKILIFALAIGGMAVSAAVYMNSDMGLAPYDALCVILSKKLSKIPFFIVRISWDLTAIVIGILFSVGFRDFKVALLGSFIMTFALGPIIQAIGKFMQEHIFAKNAPVQPEGAK